MWGSRKGLSRGGRDACASRPAHDLARGRIVLPDVGGAGGGGVAPRGRRPREARRVPTARCVHREPSRVPRRPRIGRDERDDLLGLEKGRRVLRAYAPPFPPEHRLLLVTPAITTSYGRRDEKMYRRIGEELARLAAAVPGNVAAFFPSYDLLERVLAGVRWSSVPKEVLVERRTWGKAERDLALRWLGEHQATGGLLVGVLGGGLSEGVDYRDNLLRAVCIVGLPLSPPTLEVAALKEYYAQKFGGEKGYEYAVVYPALNKVLQAAGRPIRGETDRAVIVLMDGRYLDARYAAAMPSDFHYRATGDLAREAIAFFGSAAAAT
ncbi:MAG: hypothetical protein E6K18_05415 [Methanobacteriota archaeon]|nr:MAG: hypothetical protein E6K18_05415 [Euryarchaeota archaeon]